MTSARVILSDGSVALVDAEDLPLVSQFKWTRYKRGRLAYARANGRQRGGVRGSPFSMHRLLLLPDPGMDVDHINGDGLDNRRCNLRPATRSQNLGNMRKTRGRSRYKGLHWHSRDRLWVVRVSHQGTSYSGGCFKDEVDAALAYDRLALRLFGEFARTNFLRPAGWAS